VTTPRAYEGSRPGIAAEFDDCAAASHARGVAQYLRVIQPHFHSEIHTSRWGSRSDTENAGRSLLRLAADSWRFARTLIRRALPMVHQTLSWARKRLFATGSALIARAWDERRWFYSWLGQGCERAPRFPSYPCFCGCTAGGRLHRPRQGFRKEFAGPRYKKEIFRRARTRRE